MRLDINNWNEIYQTLSRNKSRTFLTAFGVFWGIFMLVLLMGLGRGFKQLMTENFDGVSQNISVIVPSATSKPYKGFQKGREWFLSLKDIKMLTEQITDITSICPMIWSDNTNAVYQENKTNGTVYGVSSSYIDCEMPKLIYGRFINEIDEHEGRKNCVIGEKIYSSLFPKGGDPTGEYISIRNVYYQIVGVLKGESALQFGGSQTERILLPLKTAQTIYNRGEQVDFMMINAKPTAKIKDLQYKVEQIIKSAHYIAPNDDKAIFFLNTGAMFSMLFNFLENTNKLVWIVGLGTLLAGIIGVSNIMLITVRERTSEFGIRRAIGALPSDILGQILSESVVIITISGLIGISFATLCLSGVELLVQSMKNKDVIFQITFGQSIGLSILLIALGCITGSLPAYRAMTIKPIDAIRDE